MEFFTQNYIMGQKYGRAPQNIYWKQFHISNSSCWSATSLLKEIKWLSIYNIAVMSVVKLTHKILTTNWPEALAYKILSSINHTRITRTNGPHKLGPKPAHMGRTKITKYQYTNNSYQHYDKIPQILREIKHPDRFKQTEMLLYEQWWPTQQIQHTHCNRNCDPTNRKFRHSSPATGQNHSQPQPHRYHHTPRTQWKNQWSNQHHYSKK